MATVGMNTDITSLVNAIVAGDADQITGVANELVDGGAGTSELIGRIGTIVAHSDSEGHVMLTLAAASMMARWFVSLQHTLGQDPIDHRPELPLLLQAAAVATPAVQAGYKAQKQVSYPEPLFPSELAEGQTVNSALTRAIFENDTLTVERLLFGLYGTGADYRTMCIRVYDAISTTFQRAGHPFMFAVRGFQLLDAIEWGTRAPDILHWLAPHLPVHTQEPTWVETIRGFLAEPSHSLASYRTRLAAPKEEQALPLRRLILSDASMPQICQGVYDALMKNGASSRGIGSVLALTATDLLQQVGFGDNDDFVTAAHGLLYASAVRNAVTQVQEVEALPLLFTAACYLHALHSEQPASTGTAQAGTPHSTVLGGGLIAPSLIETLAEQLGARDLNGAFATAHRYVLLDHDARAMFAIIALAATRGDAAADQGHTLQIVQAAGEEYLAWPAALRDTNIDGLLHVALRAVTRQ